MPSPLTPFINKALAQPQKPPTNVPTKPGATYQGGVASAKPAPLSTGTNTFTPVAGDALSTPQTNATPVSTGEGGLQYQGLSPANQALLGNNAPQNTGLGDTTGTGAQGFLNAYANSSPQEQQALQSAYNQEQSLAQIIGGPAAQQQLSDATSQFQQGNIQNALTGQLGLANINLQNTEGQQQLTQEQEANAISQQQLGLQEQYNPQLYAITQGQEALQGKGLTLQQEGVQQQAGQADVALQQQLQQNYGNEATSGAVGTYGTKNAYAQDQYNHAQQIENLNRQGKQIGLQQSQLGLTEKQSAISEAETQAGFKISQEQIDNVAQRIGFDSSDLQQRISNAMQTLGVGQAISTDQVIQAMSDTMSGIPNQLSTVLPYILQTGNIPGGPFAYTGYSAQPSVGATTP